MSLKQVTIGSVAAAVILAGSTLAAWDQITERLPWADKDEFVELAGDYYLDRKNRVEERYFDLLRQEQKLPKGVDPRLKRQLQGEILLRWNQANELRKKTGDRPLPPPVRRRD